MSVRVAQRRRTVVNGYADRIKGVQIVDRKTKWALLATGLYLVVLLCVFGCDTWDLIQKKRLGELGDFTAGVLTPVFFGWLVLGYFLQRQELGLQRQELGLQRQEFQQMQKALGEQVVVMKEQADADRQRSMPWLILEKDNSVVRGEGGVEDEWGRTDPNSFLLRNTGGPARNLEIDLGADGEDWSEGVPSLDTDKTCPVHISNPFLSYDLFELAPAARPSNDQSTSCIVRFLSERQERFEQRWSIRFTAKNSHDPGITEITDGPSQPAEG